MRANAASLERCDDELPSVSWEEEITCALVTDYSRMFRKSLLLQASDKVPSKSQAFPLLFLLNTMPIVARGSQTGFEPPSDTPLPTVRPGPSRPFQAIGYLSKTSLRGLSGR